MGEGVAMERVSLSPRQIPYDEWMKNEDIPVYEAAAGTPDLFELPRRPWARTGGSGTFIQLLGAKQAERGIYVGEIPGGGALNPEKHLYHEVIFILKGLGATEVWWEGEQKRTFEWGEGSLFAPPLNTRHRLINGSRESVIFMAVTTAPKIINAFGAHDFIFECDYKFRDLYDARDSYFAPTEDRRKEGRFNTNWHTNFIPDANAVFLDDMEQKVSGGQLTGYRMEGGFPSGHMSEWPTGRYHKAHYHGPGAILIGLIGEGYVLVWPRELGVHPYSDRRGDQVLSIPWGPRTIYCPPDGWYHQHFNSDSRPARHIAVYGPPTALSGFSSVIGGDFGANVSFREGGTLIDYEDEDPVVRQYFEEILGRKGLRSAMPPVKYRAA